MEKIKHVAPVKAAQFSAILLVLFLILAGHPAVRAEENISGKLEKGLRVIAVDGLAASPDLRVFRGDYIRFDSKADLVFSVPAMDIETELRPHDPTYFKMKETGVYDYFLGDISGTITVVEYEGAHYQALDAVEAAAMIREVNPLILDVRTPMEFQSGRIENASLIPVQVLAQNLDKIADHKDAPVLIYCATGNRSTVAAKILIDNGFTRVFNLSHGIKEWQQKGLPVTR